MRFESRTNRRMKVRKRMRCESRRKWFLAEGAVRGRASLACASWQQHQKQAFLKPCI